MAQPAPPRGMAVLSPSGLTLLSESSPSSCFSQTPERSTTDGVIDRLLPSRFGAESELRVSAGPHALHRPLERVLPACPSSWWLQAFRLHRPSLSPLSHEDPRHWI